MNPRQIEYHQVYRRDLLPGGGHDGSPRLGRGGWRGRGGGGRSGGQGYFQPRGISGGFRR